MERRGGTKQIHLCLQHVSVVGPKCAVQVAQHREGTTKKKCWAVLCICMRWEWPRGNQCEKNCVCHAQISQFGLNMLCQVLWMFFCVHMLSWHLRDKYWTTFMPKQLWSIYPVVFFLLFFFRICIVKNGIRFNILRYFFAWTMCYWSYIRVLIPMTTLVCVFLIGTCM